MQALEELDYLAALDNDGNLSEMGIIMSELPLEPQTAKTLLASCEFDCVSEVVIIAAMLTGSAHSTLPPRLLLGSVLHLIHLCLLAPTCFIVPSVDLRPEAARCHQRFQHPEGDHFTLINIYKAFKQRQHHPCEIKAALNHHIHISIATKSLDSLSFCC